MDKFIIGCNYWASNAGTEMWRQWDENAIREDFAILAAHGITHLRVFPNWRDFQPILPIYAGGGSLVEYRLEGDRLPQNPEYLDETMLSRFSRFCDIAEEYGLSLIVGILTGWMSGRLFIPSALYNKNLFTDPTALLFEQRFVRGIVRGFKDKKAIVAWDLGNECNCMSAASDVYAATDWTGIIANAIRAADASRPIVSGMHSLGVEDTGVTWTVRGQAEFCDVLTTHPYPYWVNHTYKDRTLSFRTTMHATCETKYYADLGKKPCLVEEIGTMGPMLCDNDAAAAFMRVNLFSNWANGAVGVMWWCANEQTDLMTVPYTTNSCEIELGMIDAARRPKPVLTETARVAKVLRELNFSLPQAEIDAVCVLTRSQDQWGAAYMTYCLAKQAGLTLSFAYGDDPLPQAELYLLPSLSGNSIQLRERYLELKSRVRDGAALYISNNDAIIPEFEELCGARVSDSEAIAETDTTMLGTAEIHFTRNRRYLLAPTHGSVLAADSNGNPAVLSATYGKGKVYYVNFPAETALLSQNNAFDQSTYRLYAELFGDTIKRHVVRTENPYIALTCHKVNDREYFAVLINHSAQTQKPQLLLSQGFAIDEVYYGNVDAIPPCDAAIVRLKKQ